jgi:HK97 family phage prohead protease
MVTKRLARPFQIKSVSEKGEFSGYGSVFDVVDSYGDVVIKGAFANSLDAWKAKGKWPAMLWQHRSAEPIGVWTNMKEDDHGLLVEGRILLEAGATEKRAYEHLKAGSISGLSIGYAIPPGGLEYDKITDTFRLKQIDLWEVSPVTFPANPEAQVETVKAALETPRDFERFLREAGLSRSQAKGLIARGYEGLRDLREAEDEGLEAVKGIVEFLSQHGPRLIGAPKET